MGHFHSTWFPQDPVPQASPPPPPQPPPLPGPALVSSQPKREKQGSQAVAALPPPSSQADSDLVSVWDSLKPAVPGGQDSHQWEARPRVADPAARSASLLSQTWGTGGLWPFFPGGGGRGALRWGRGWVRGGKRRRRGGTLPRTHLHGTRQSQRVHAQVLLAFLCFCFLS